MRRNVRRQLGYSATELVIVVTIIGLLLAIAIPRGQLFLDRISVRSAASDVLAILTSARSLALAGHSAVAIDIDSASGVVRVRRGAELLLARNVGQAHGVQVARTRDSLTYDAHGLGRGAANLSVILRRRSAAETVFVSRFGRAR